MPSLCLLLLMLAPAPAVFFKEIFEEMLREEPEFATYVGRHEYDGRWTDWSKEGRDRRAAMLRRRLEQVRAFPLAGVSVQDRLTLRLLEYEFRSRLEADDLENHLLRVGQLYGLHNEVYDVIGRMPAHTLGDFENILARLRGIPAYVEQNIGLIREGVASGVVQPRVVADLVSAQLAAQVAQSDETTPLLAAFRRIPSSFSAAEQASLRERGAEAYHQAFLPAWHKLHTFIADEYIKNVRPQPGISSMRGGAQAYAILVRRLTTTNMKPDEIHQLGLAEVKRIEQEMQQVAREAGFKGTVAEFERHLAASSEQRFRSKDEMLMWCRNIAKIIEPELSNQFRHIPVLLYGVRPIPPDREAATATNAQPQEPGAVSPGWFNLNTYQPEKQVKYDKESLVLHEAVPGHLFQLAVAQSLHDLPEIRRFYMNSAYVEGWALYAESLGTDLGVYRDPYSRFGQLASERLRAVRLVVDTGLHALGWSRQQAIDYFQAHAPESSLAEVDRYISWPGQALSYKLGQLKIRQLRGTLEKRQGAQFDVREFHDRILRNGTLPLELLEQVVLQ